MVKHTGEDVCYTCGIFCSLCSVFSNSVVGIFSSLPLHSVHALDDGCYHRWSPSVHGPCAALAAEVEELQRRVAATKTGYEAAAAKLAEKRACLVEREREHSALAAEKSELQGKLGEAAAERKARCT